MTAFDRLAFVSSSPEPSRAREIFDGLCRVARRDPRGQASALEAARRVKRQLVRDGFRDDAMTFLVHDMLERRAGNCLGLTLLIGAALIDAGHDDVGFVLRLNPYDDVHDAGKEHHALLCGDDGGVDPDSRLPEAGDVSSRFRFVPVEHASLVLSDDQGVAQPFEATNLARDALDSAWAPDAETVRRISFDEASSIVLSDRAKMEVRTRLPGSVRATGSPAERRVLRRALRLLLWSTRAWPENREAWAEIWRVASSLAGVAPGHGGSEARVMAIAHARYASFASSDALYHFTLYRMTRDVRHLDEALARFPEYAEALFERKVVCELASKDRDATRRALLIVAWMVAESEILSLERFYREHYDVFAAVFSASELEEILSSFA